jgi:hypothetical protein
MLLTLLRYWPLLAPSERLYLAAHGLGCLAWRALSDRLRRHRAVPAHTLLSFEEGFASLLRLTVFVPAGTGVIKMWSAQLYGGGGSAPTSTDLAGQASAAAKALLLLLFGTETLSLALLGVCKPVRLW